MKWRIAVRIVLGLAGGAALHSQLCAQSGTSVWDGIYTKDQATRGGELYRKSCASCHGDDLSGQGQAPPLSGDDFKAGWSGMTVGDLFDRIQTSMPADSPGSLKPEQNAGILAFILQVNQFPPAGQELSSDTDSLKKIRFEAAKPKK